MSAIGYEYEVQHVCTDVVNSVLSMHVLLILEVPGPCQSQSDKQEVYSTATRTSVDSFLMHSLHRRILNASSCFRQLFKKYITIVLRHDCSHYREHYYGFTIILNFIGGFSVVLT